MSNPSKEAREHQLDQTLQAIQEDLGDQLPGAADLPSKHPVNGGRGELGHGASGCGGSRAGVTDLARRSPIPATPEWGQRGDDTTIGDASLRQRIFVTAQNSPPAKLITLNRQEECAEMKFQELPSRKRSRLARRLDNPTWHEKAITQPPEATTNSPNDQKGTDIEARANNLLSHIPGEASGFYLMSVEAFPSPSSKVLWILFAMSLILTVFLRYLQKSSPALIGSTVVAFLIWMTAMDQGVFRTAFPELFTPPLGFIIAIFYSIVVTALADRGILKWKPICNVEQVNESTLSLQEKIASLDAAIDAYRANGEDPSPVINAQHLLRGQLAEAQSDYAAAATAYERSLDGFRSAGWDQEVAILALKAARAHEHLENHKKAFDRCHEAVEALESLRAKTSFTARLAPSRLSVETLDFAIRIAHICNDDPQLFTWIQKAKSRWLNDMMARQHEVTEQTSLLQKPTASNQQEYGDFKRAIADLDQGWNLYFDEQIDQASLTALQERLDQAFSRLNPDSSADQDYTSKSGDSAKTSSLQDIQNILAGTEAILELFVQTDGVYIALIRADRFNVVLKPIPADELKDMVLMLYLNMIQSKSRHAYTEEMKAQAEPEKLDVMHQMGKILYQDPKILLQELYGLLLEPLLRDLEGVTRVIICPHWVLHLVPFHAMGKSVAHGDLLIHQRAFTYCPSATIWARLRNANKHNHPVLLSKSLILGVEKKTSGNWLQGVLDFLARIRGDVQLSDFEAEACDVASDLKVAAVSGSEATKAQFFDHFPNSDIVHLSCHSAISSRQPSANGLLLADGILTVAEILTDQRIGTAKPELISLSACRSGLDKIEPGDQLVGIGPAFLARCGSNILSSRWPVHSEATRILMGALYKNYPISQDWAEALRQAQLITMKSTNRAGLDFHEPYFWSAFFIMGH